MAADIPTLKTFRDSAAVSSSGSWFHSLMVDRKKETSLGLVARLILGCVKATPLGLVTRLVQG